MKQETGKLILVVDDVADNRDMYAQFLSYKGFRVALAGDGLEAFDKAAQLQPALIVMDLSLPQMDGWETTRRLKRNQSTKHIPVVALTAHAHEGVAEGAKEAGCDEFITKPCPPDELAAKIMEMLDQMEGKIDSAAKRRASLYK
jgi:two-component system cell cycle response regulator DivK